MQVTPELITIIKHHILKMLSGSSGNDFIKQDKNQGPDVNITKLHKNFLQQYEPLAIDQESGKIVVKFYQLIGFSYYYYNYNNKLR